SGALLISAAPALRLGDSFLAELRAAAAAQADALILYSNYYIQKGAKQSEVVLHDHEGCPHERFDFGQLLAYRVDAVREAGLFDESLQHAWEYDMHLKLMEKGHFIRIAKPIYTVVEPETEEAKGALYSPGRGKLGGFSYVFYPAD